jgi:hypothetical protein
MIGLKIGSKFLDMGVAKITLEIYNTLLLIGIVRDSFSYAFSIPYTANNENILGSVGKLGSTAMHQEDFACQIYLEGVLWATGVLMVEEATAGDSYKIKINFDYGAFADAIGEKKVATCMSIANAGGQAITQTASGYNFFSLQVFSAPYPGFFPETVNYEILVDGVSYATYIETPTTSLFDIATELADKFNANISINENWVAYGFLPTSFGEKITLLPVSATATNVVTYRIRQQTTFPTMQFWEQSYSFTTVLETRPALNDTYTHIAFPVIKAQKFYEDKNPDFGGTLNEFSSGYFTNTLAQFVKPRATPSGYNDFSHCPCLYLHSIITWVCASVGWTWEGNFKDSTIFQKLLLYSNYASDEIDGFNIPAEFNFNRHQRAITYTDLAPDMTAKEFFDQIQEIFCLYYDFDATAKVLYINFKKNVFDSNAKKSLNTKKIITLERNERKKNIQLAYQDDLNISAYYPTTVEGNYRTTETIALRAGAMPYESIVIPALWAGKGNSNMFSLGEKNGRDKMYFFFWRGLQNVQSQPKPIATGLGSYGAGDLMPANGFYLYSLWSSYIDYLLFSKKAEALLWLDIDDLRGFIRSLAFKYKYGELVFLIEKIQCEIDMSQAGKVAAKAETRKIAL